MLMEIYRHRHLNELLKNIFVLYISYNSSSPFDLAQEDGIKCPAMCGWRMLYSYFVHSPNYPFSSFVSLLKQHLNKFMKLELSMAMDIIVVDMITRESLLRKTDYGFTMSESKENTNVAVQVKLDETINQGNTEQKWYSTVQADIMKVLYPNCTITLPSSNVDKKVVIFAIDEFSKVTSEGLTKLTCDLLPMMYHNKHYTVIPVLAGLRLEPIESALSRSNVKCVPVHLRPLSICSYYILARQWFKKMYPSHSDYQIDQLFGSNVEELLFKFGPVPQAMFDSLDSYKDQCNVSKAIKVAVSHRGIKSGWKLLQPAIVNSVCEVSIPETERNALEYLGIAHVNDSGSVKLPFYAFTLIDNKYNQQNSHGFASFSDGLQDTMAYLNEYLWNSTNWKMFEDFTAAYMCVKINSRGVLVASGKTHIETHHCLSTIEQSGTTHVETPHSLKTIDELVPLFGHMGNATNSMLQNNSYAECSLKEVYNGAYFPQNMPEKTVSLEPISLLRSDSYLTDNNLIDSIDSTYCILLALI